MPSVSSTSLGRRFSSTYIGRNSLVFSFRNTDIPKTKQKNYPLGSLKKERIFVRISFPFTYQQKRGTQQNGFVLRSNITARKLQTEIVSNLSLIPLMVYTSQLCHTIPAKNLCAKGQIFRAGYFLIR